MMRDHTIPMCPIPGLGHCVRERCNFWDEQTQECTSDCNTATEPIDATGEPDPDRCIISFYEDYD